MQLEFLETRRLLAADWMEPLPSHSSGQSTPAINEEPFANHVEIEVLADRRFPGSEQPVAVTDLSKLAEIRESPADISGVTTPSPVSDSLVPIFSVTPLTSSATNSSAVVVADTGSVFSEPLSNNRRSKAVFMTLKTANPTIDIARNETSLAGQVDLGAVGPVTTDGFAAEFSAGSQSMPPPTQDRRRDVANESLSGTLTSEMPAPLVETDPEVESSPNELTEDFEVRPNRTTSDSGLQVTTAELAPGSMPTMDIAENLRHHAGELVQHSSESTHEADGSRQLILPNSAVVFRVEPVMARYHRIDFGAVTVQAPMFPGRPCWTDRSR